MIDKDEKLLSGIKNKKPKYLEKAINLYGGYVKVIVINVCRDYISSHDHDEIISDVFISLWTHSNTIQGNLKAWLGAVARNKAKSALRRNYVIITDINDEFISVNDVWEKAEENERAVIISDALNSLNDTDKDIFLRYYYYYQTTEEIAEILSMNRSTVKTHLARGRVKLKNYLIERGHANENEYI